METHIDELNKVLQDWGNRVVVRIQENLDSTGTTASGRTKESLEAVADMGELIIYGRQYFQGVEQGRPAGGIPYRFPDIIYQWASDKGIIDNFGQTEKEKRKVSAAIAYFIKNHGTKLYRDGGRQDIYTDVINEMLPELQEGIGVIVKETLVKNL